MANKDLIRIKHMLDSVNCILQFIKGKHRSDLENDRLLCSGIIRELEILGEAAGKVSEASQNRYLELPWKQVIGMRNRLIHAYFDIDHDIIWKTIHDYLPSLQKELERVVLDFQTFLDHHSENF